jgi:hypothetical protein
MDQIYKMNNNYKEFSSTSTWIPKIIGTKYKKLI